jgi:hypothetical protein
MSIHKRDTDSHGDAKSSIPLDTDKKSRSLDEMALYGKDKYKCPGELSNTFTRVEIT